MKVNFSTMVGCRSLYAPPLQVPRRKRPAEIFGYIRISQSREFFCRLSRLASWRARRRLDKLVETIEAVLPWAGRPGIA